MDQSTFNMRNRRKELKLTLEDIGKHVGVSKGTVSKWENGNIKNMRSDKIALLAEKLQVSITDILSVYQNNQELPVIAEPGSLDDPDEDDENFVHPEDRAAQRRNILRDSSADEDEEEFIHPEDRRAGRGWADFSSRKRKRQIMYCDIDGKPVYEEFSKEDFDFIVQTIKMLKSKEGSK